MEEVTYAPRILFYNTETGLVIAQRNAIHGSVPAELNPDEIGFIYVDDETTPAIRVTPVTKEVEWEPVNRTPVIEDVADNLIQQGITPDMLTQIQETMAQQAATMRQQTTLTE